MTRKLASTLLAAVPESDYETALKWFEKAEQVQPDFYIDNTFMIGKCYAKGCSLFKSKMHSIIIHLLVWVITSTLTVEYLEK